MRTITVVICIDVPTSFSTEDFSRELRKRLSDFGFVYSFPKEFNRDNDFSWRNYNLGEIRDESVTMKFGGDSFGLNDCLINSNRDRLIYTKSVYKTPDDFITVWKRSFLLKDVVVPNVLPGINSRWLVHPADQAMDWELEDLNEISTLPLPEEHERRLSDYSNLSQEAKESLKATYMNSESKFESVIWFLPFIIVAPVLVLWGFLVSSLPNRMQVKTFVIVTVLLITPVHVDLMSTTLIPVCVMLAIGFVDNFGLVLLSLSTHWIWNVCSLILTTILAYLIANKFYVVHARRTG